MTRYRVLAWHDIPTLIQVTDDSGAVVKRPMPPWFSEEIDRISMREGLVGSDDYAAGFAWTSRVEREGTAEEVAEAVSMELCAKFGRTPDGQGPAADESPAADGPAADQSPS